MLSQLLVCSNTTSPTKLSSSTLVSYLFLDMEACGIGPRLAKKQFQKKRKKREGVSVVCLLVYVFGFGCNLILTGYCIHSFSEIGFKTSSSRHDGLGGGNILRWTRYERVVPLACMFVGMPSQTELQHWHYCVNAVCFAQTSCLHRQ